MANISNEMAAYAEDARKECERRIELALRNYAAGKRDCKLGIYDKWYRRHAEHDGRAYDLGWVEQSEETQNDRVKFLENN